MSKEFIINDAYFGKIKDLPISGETIKQFIDNVVYKHPNWDMLLQNLSDIYIYMCVLVASFDAQTYCRDGEKTWKEIMKREEYDILEKNRKLVIAYMLITEKNQNIHYIDLFDTIVRNNNLGRVMIQKYKRDHDDEVILIPQEIIKTAAKYWAKVLYIEDKEDIEERIECYKCYGLDSKDLSWEHLYDLFELKEETEEENGCYDGEEPVKRYIPPSDRNSDIYCLHHYMNFWHKNIVPISNPEIILLEDDAKKFHKQCGKEIAKFIFCVYDSGCVKTFGRVYELYNNTYYFKEWTDEQICSLKTVAKTTFIYLDERDRKLKKLKFDAYDLFCDIKNGVNPGSEERGVMSSCMRKVLMNQWPI